MTALAAPPLSPVPPLRTWRPMALWTLGILLALGLVWFVAAVVVPVWRVREVVSDMDSRFVLFEERDVPLGRNDVLDRVAELGGPEAMFDKMLLYTRMPRSVAPHRHMAAYFMGYGGRKATGQLARLFRDTDPKVRRFVVMGLFYNAMDTGNAEALPTLIAGLADPDSAVRDEAIADLAVLAGCFPEVGPLLREALHRDEKRLVAGALLALSKMGKAAPSLWGARYVWRSEDAERQLRNTSAEGAGPEVEALLAHEDPEIGCLAAMSLWMITNDGRKPLALLLERLRDTDPRTRYCALDVLDTLWDRAAAAVPAMAEMKEDPEPAVRERAKRTASRCSPFGLIFADDAEGARRLEVLLAEVADENWEVRARAIMELDWVTPDSAAGVRSAMDKAAQDEHPVVRQCAAYILGKSSPPSSGEKRSRKDGEK